MSGSAVTVAAVADDDMDLVSAVREGDDRAFEELYERYQPRISGYVRGMVKDHARAEDVTQEIFFSALRRMRQTDRPIAFKPWIYEIARNACIDAYRRTSRAEELSFDADGSLAPADSMRLVSSRPGPDDAVERKQQLDDLCGAFGGLSDTHHQILVLRELEGLSYREIGERLGMSRAAVESTLFRARRRLSEEYDELVSGRRCRRVQAIIAAAAEGMLGTRDRRRLTRHVSSCHSCRRQALHLGVEVHERPSVAARIAGLLPFPIVFGRGRHGSAHGAAASHPGSGLLAQAPTLGAAAEPMAAAWTKAVAAVAVVALAGAGAGAVSKTGVPVPGLGKLPVIGSLAKDRDATPHTARGVSPAQRAADAVSGALGASGGALEDTSRPTDGRREAGAGAAQRLAPAGPSRQTTASAGGSTSEPRLPAAPVDDTPKVSLPGGVGGAGDADAPIAPDEPTGGGDVTDSLGDGPDVSLDASTPPPPKRPKVTAPEDPVDADTPKGLAVGSALRAATA